MLGKTSECQEVICVCAQLERWEPRKPSCFVHGMAAKGLCVFKIRQHAVNQRKEDESECLKHLWVKFLPVGHYGTYMIFN